MKFPTRLLILSESAILMLLCIINIRTFHPEKIFSATEHIVISQIQIAGTGNTNQEFVELYNPTETNVDMSGWRLAKESSSGASLSNLVASMSGTIDPHKYFLIAHPQYSNPSLSVDRIYSSSSSGIANNNTVILFSDAGHTAIDTVGMGLAVDHETVNAPNPAADQSIIRKASETSTADTLSPGGVEEHAGNGFDSDNNASDFVLLEAANPKNSSTPQSPPIVIPSVSPSETPTPIETPILTVTPTPTETPTPTPTETETQTPTPTETIAPTPTETITPTPTETVSPTPTETLAPTPTDTPSPTITPQPTITLTPTPFIIHQYPFPNGMITCTWTKKIFTLNKLIFFYPVARCKTVKM